MSYLNPQNKVEQLAYDIYVKFNNMLPEINSDGSSDVVEAGALDAPNVAQLANKKMTEIEYAANWEYQRDLFELGVVHKGDTQIPIPKSVIDAVYNLATGRYDNLLFVLPDGTQRRYEWASPPAISSNKNTATLIGKRKVLFNAAIPPELDGATVSIGGFRSFTRIDPARPEAAVIDVQPYDLLVYAAACQAALVNPAWSFRYPNLFSEYTTLLNNAKSYNLAIGGTTVERFTSDNVAFYGGGNNL